MENRVCLHFAVSRAGGTISTRNGQIVFDGVKPNEVWPSCPEYLTQVWSKGVDKVNHALSCVSFILNSRNRKWITKTMGVGISRVVIEMDIPGSGLCPVKSFRDVSNATELIITIDCHTTLSSDGYSRSEGIFELLRAHVIGIEQYFVQEFCGMREILKDIQVPQHLPMLQLLSDARPVMNMAVGSASPLKEYACGRTFTDDPYPSDWKAFWYKHVLSLRMNSAHGSASSALSSESYGLNTYYAIQRVTNDSTWNFLPSNPKSRYNKEVIMQDLKAIWFWPVASSPDSDDDGIGPDE